MHSFIYEFTYIFIVHNVLYTEHCVWVIFPYSIDICTLFYHMSFILDTSMVTTTHSLVMRYSLSYTDLELILATSTWHSGQGLLSYEESSYIADLTSKSIISKISLCSSKTSFKSNVICHNKCDICAIAFHGGHELILLC